MAKVKTFLFTFLITAFSIMFIAGCGSSSTNLGGGNSTGTDNGTGGDNSTGGDNGTSTVTPVDEFPANPLALLGIYDITSQTVNDISKEVTAGSEFRVNVDLTRLNDGFVDVLVRIIVDNKKVEFTREVSLAGQTIGTEFFEKIFTDMGAKVTGKYTLEFTLASTQYPEIVSNNIIQDGETLVLNLYKTKDLEANTGLDDSNTPPTEPEVVPVEKIQITTPEKSYYTGSTVTIDFTLTPTNTTDTDVTYETTNNGSGTVKAENGMGQLILKNVTQNDTVIFKVSDKQVTYNIVIVNEVESISFLNATETIEQNQTRTIAIENYDVIKDSFSSITYSVVDETKASINSTTGEVTGLKNGVTQVNVTATRLDNKQLTASYELDVLGYIDYNDASSLEGTYEIVFFGTNTNDSGLAKAVISNNCTVYNDFKWNNNFECPTGTGGYEIPGTDFVGRAVIKNDNGNVLVNTKVGFKGNGLIQSMSADDQYQYTNYPITSLSSFLNTSNTGTLEGRHLTATTTSTNATYYFEKDANYTIKADKDIVLFTKISKEVDIVFGTKTVYPDTRLVLRKISSKIIAMNPNTISEEPFNVLQSKLSLKSSGDIEASIK